MIFKSAFIKEAAKRAGFDICGIAASRNLDAERAFFEGWLHDGKEGGLDYMRRNADKRFDPGLLVENAKSVIVCGVSYRNIISGGYPEGCPEPKVSSYALCADYHETIKGMLRRLAAELEAEYGVFGHRAFCDSAPVLEKRWAFEAGLGWQGRNSLMINPESGSFFFLGELVADTETDFYDKPYEGNGCGNCRRCVERCPNGAIGEGRSVDTRRCISCATIEKRGETSEEGHAQVSLHGWIYGCDECQSCCPFNAAAPEYRNPDFAPLFDPRTLTREFWLSISEREFDERFGATPMKRAGIARLRRNLE